MYYLRRHQIEKVQSNVDCDKGKHLAIIFFGLHYKLGLHFLSTILFSSLKFFDQSTLSNTHPMIKHRFNTEIRSDNKINFDRNID